MQRPKLETSHFVHDLATCDDQLSHKTNKKSHVSYRMAPMSMTLSDLQCHFSCRKPFDLGFINEYHTY